MELDTQLAVGALDLVIGCSAADVQRRIRLVACIGASAVPVAQHVHKAFRKVENLRSPPDHVLFTLRDLPIG